MKVCQSLKSSCKQSLVWNLRSLEGVTISDLSNEMYGCFVQTSLSEAPSCSECVRNCSIPHNSHCPKIDVDTVLFMWICFLTQWKTNVLFPTFRLHNPFFTQRLEVYNLLPSSLNHFSYKRRCQVCSCALYQFPSCLLLFH